MTAAIADGARLHRAVRPRLRRRAGADPVAAADRRRAPPPDPASKTRTQVGLIVEAGDVREVHHVALLIGYGASAVNPYLAMETVEDLAAHGLVPGRRRRQKAVRNLIKALGKGVLKVMSKMGISTVASYHGAQVFEAVGLDQELVDRYFTGTTLQARRRRARRARRGGRRAAHGWPTRRAGPPTAPPHARRRRRVPVAPRGRAAPVQPRDGVPAAARDPRPPLRRLQAVHPRGGRAGRAADDAARAVPVQGRGDARPPVPIDEVEPVAEIVKRFSTGAMSYGSISQEAHETLAIAMNRLGGKSNTGEGGEDPDRLYDRAALARSSRSPAGGSASPASTSSTPTTCRSRWRRARSPARAGSCPGNKVYPWIAKTRHSTPGVGLISPPPHHDIYSIEDLAQLIHDLKNANNRRPGARQARRRGRRRHRRRGRQQGARRRGPHLRPRRRHGRVAADVAQARGRAVGARPRRDPADAAAQRPARPHRRADRRPAQDRSRRRRSPRCSAPRSSASRPRRWSSAAAS